jgi:hypothetical protein
MEQGLDVCVGKQENRVFAEGRGLKRKRGGDSSDVVESDDSVRPGVLVFVSLMAKVWLAVIIDKLFRICRYL